MTGSKFRMMSAQESGIGGLLLLFAIWLVLDLVVALITLPGSWFATRSTDVAAMARIYSAYPYVVMGEFAFALVRVAGLVIGLVLIIRHDRRAPVFFVAFLGIVIALTLIDMSFGSRYGDAVHAYLAQQGRSSADYDSAHLTARHKSIGSLMWTAGWLLYWHSSERVRLTFTPGPGMTEIPTQS